MAVGAPGSVRNDLSCRCGLVARVRRAAVIAGALWGTAVIAEPATVSGIARIVDGDTLDVGVVRIRLHGIDAPEAGQRCGKVGAGTWACGTEATNRLAELAEGKRIECDALDRDAYGRIIGVCRQAETDINAVLIDEGLAWAFTRFSDVYAEREAAARTAGIGIWQGEAEPAWEYRANRWARAVEASPGGCPIKGNINRQGERIYHTPWSPWYDRTQVDEQAGERWFCDEADAQAAGWRAPYWR